MAYIIKHGGIHQTDETQDVFTTYQDAFEYLVKNHDWDGYQSDDFAKWAKGKESQRLIEAAFYEADDSIKAELQELYRAYYSLNAK